jgi:hypothetical protein
MWDPGGGRSLNSRLEAAPTESLSNGNLDFPDKQVNIFYFHPFLYYNLSNLGVKTIIQS